MVGRGFFNEAELAVTKRRRIRIILLTALLAVSAGGYWWWRDAMVPQVLGGMEFRIPVNYFRQPPPNTRGKEQDIISLYATLPDFKPRTKQNRARFDEAPLITITYLALVYMPRQPSEEKRFEIYQQYLEGGDGVTTSFGLRKHHFRKDNVFAKNVLYSGTYDKGKRINIRCREGFNLEVFCKSRTPITADVQLDITFNGSFLPVWKSVHRRAVDLVKSFEVLPKK